VAAFALAQLQTAQDQLALAGEARHSGIHQARKSLRRTRAALALGRRVFGRRVAGLDDELGRMCRGLSGLRDAQALLEELERLAPMAATESAAVMSSAQVVAMKVRDKLLDRALLRDPDLQSRRRRLQLAQKRLAALDWQSLDDSLMVRSVKRSRRRAEKAGARARRRPDDGDAWHIYRRRLRRLHQQHTILDTLQPGLLPEKLDLDERASALGEVQDDALLLRRCSGHSPFPVELRPVLRAIARDRLRKARHY
jgi:CHAD domain-containing protein